MSFPVLSTAASGSEDDEREIASPPFEPLNTHSSPLPGDALSSLIRYLEESRLSADNQRIQDEQQRCQRDEERRLRDTEARIKEEDSRFSVLVTLLSPLTQTAAAASARDIPSPPTTPRCRCERRSTHWSRPPATSTAPLAASSVAAKAHRRDLSRQACGPQSTDVAGRLFLPSFPAVASSVGRYSTMLDSQRLPRHKQLIQLRMAVSLDVQGS
ncbi:hypothetical protein GWK47_025934 [Chionoecetes opilio]|uniref:Uncharacterized protein n=1 Tax=Chionoecetes opilio TaxID=41210 RepID=A0A8J8WAR4_CHIOP|nr:hypothetical protein GWK47_025934 [Chionoecetes opilio]